jgi:hypothetical protein
MQVTAVADDDLARHSRSTRDGFWETGIRTGNPSFGRLAGIPYK